jgi:josephin
LTSEVVPSNTQLVIQQKVDKRQDLMNNLYFERQERMHCAVHCANNLLQEKRFSKQDFDVISEELHKIQQQQEQSGMFNSFFNPHKSILGLGNFDVNVLVKAFEKVGYSMNWVDKRLKCVEILEKNKNALGLIINIKESGFSIGSLFGNRHWIALKPISEDSWINLDSKLPAPLTLTQSEMYNLLSIWIRDNDALVFSVTPLK